MHGRRLNLEQHWLASILVIRGMFGLTGASATNGAIGAGATRSTWAQIRSYLNANCGMNFAP